MKTSTFCVVLCLSVIQSFAQRSDYCKPTLCQSGRHIGCGNKNQYALTCPKDAKIVNRENYKNVFVNEHNRVRNIIATGNLVGYYPAMRMATVTWDNELARLAEMLVKTCISSYDECRNTDRFSAVGQNIASTTIIGSYSVAKLIEDTVDKWFKEHSIINRSYVSTYKMDDNFNTSRHFAQLALSRATRVGCAIIEFTDGTRTRVNVVCNYSARPMHNQALYTEGCSVAQCLQGHNTNFQGLCTQSELIDPNNYIY
ncbi:unnamed protein product [Hermetia illucens]|uniref:SCP domain-containing protein n=1 Tax=Hermetia illucens TaxID=343691 RepID=A0A7R8V2X7_HERIL|nr:antigen 5 like allergen Cul n 1-like [Hermetia illucens]CAD7091192.1 unnamed protein product [Hermetia illucens]